MKSFIVVPSDRLVMVLHLPVGTSYKFRVVAVNVIGSSPPSAPSKAYTVVGGRTHERPVDGPYITYNEAINETTIILKWTVSYQRNPVLIRIDRTFWRPV